MSQSVRRGRVILALFLALGALGIQAQTCPPPVITQIGGANPSCAGQPVTLDAGSGWTSYLWSNGATTRIITDTPSATTNYTVTTVDSNGCSVTSAALAVTVYDNPPAPQITPREATLCAGSTGQATSNAAAMWTILHGTFTSNPDDVTTVNYQGDGTGDIQLTATVTDANGCSAATTATVSVRSAEIPVINVSTPSVCPGNHATASLAPPANAAWQIINWTITGGSFITEFYPYTAPYASGQNVTFAADGTGPVTLSVQAEDSYGCMSAVGTKTVALRSISAPVISTVSTTCPYANQTASIAPPAEGTWGPTNWQITGGKFRTTYYPYESTYASGDTVTFYADGTGPATLSVRAEDSFGCMSPEATKTVTIRTIAPPVIITTVSNTCPYANQTATIAPPAEGTWGSVTWQITGGKFRTTYYPYESTYGGGETVTFYADGSGPVTLSVHADDSFGCMSPEGTKTIGIRTIEAPVIITSVSNTCPYANQTATIAPPAEGTWGSVTWQITGGKFRTDYYPYESTYGGGENVTFYADGSGPVTLSVHADDSFGCMSPEGTKTVGIRTIAAPVITTSAAVTCPYTNQTATIAPPAEGTWGSVTWQITGGKFRTDYYPYESIYTGGENVTFFADGSGPVTLSVHADDSFGCMSPEGTKTVALRAIDVPVITTSVESTCQYFSQTAAVAPPAAGGSWMWVNWSISNGKFRTQYGDQPYASGESVTFYADGNGPVTLTVWAGDNLGCYTQPANKTVSIRTIDVPVITTSVESTCPNFNQTASVAPPAAGGSWMWVNWSISNGKFRSQYGGDQPYASGETVTFYADGNGPVTLTAWAGDNLGCYTPPGNKTVSIRTIDVPVITTSVESTCPNFNQTASVAPPAAGGSWMWVNWSISGGRFRSQYGGDQPYASGETVTFYADGNGPVTLTAWAGDNLGCYTPPANKTVSIRTIEAPVITTSVEATCPNHDQTASVAPPAAGGSWMWVNWSISGGKFRSQYGGDQTYASGETVTFYADGSGPVTLTAWAGDNLGCYTPPGNKTVSLRTLDAPVIATNVERTCPNVRQAANLEQPAGGGSWMWINWSISGGTFLDSGFTPTSAYGPSVTFAADGSGPVVLSAWAGDASGCTTPVATKTMPVDTPTATITANGPTSFCTGGSVTLTANAGASYLWSNGATTQAITVNQTGTYFVDVTSSPGCMARSNPVAVTVNSITAPAITAPAKVCIGGSGQASISGTYSTIQWTASNATITGAANQATVSFQASANVYDVGLTVTVTDANGCTATASKTIAKASLPYPELLGSTVCPNGNAIAMPRYVTPGSTYTWAIQNGTITSTYGAQNEQLNFVAAASGSTVVTVTETTSEGCSNTATATWTVRTLQAFDFTVNAACPNGPGSATFSGSWTPTGYTWQVAGGTITSGQYARTVNFTSDGSGPMTITLTAQDSNYCQQSVTKTVALRTLAPPTLTGTTTLCPNGNGTASVGGGYDAVTWSVTNGTILNTGSTFVNYRADTSGNVVVTATVRSGTCTSSNSITVPIQDTTPPPITAPDSICYGGRFTASVPAGYASYSWNWTGAWHVSGSGNTQVFQHDTPYATPTPTEVVLTVDMTTSTGCHVIATKTIPLVAPVGPIITTDVPANFCTGMTGTASVSNGPYATYAWSVTGATLTSPADQPVVTFVPDGSQGSVGLWLDVTDGRGDCRTSGSRAVALTNPTAYITVTSGSTSLCAGQSATLKGQDGAESYLWSTGATTQSISVSAAGSYTVTTTKNGCTLTSPPVTISAVAMTASISADRTSYCTGGQATLSASWTGGKGTVHAVYWYATDSQFPVGGGQNVYSYAANSSYTRTYYCIVSDDMGCSARSQDITITVLPKPAATITPSGSTTFCEGGSVTLTASAGSSWLWSNGATTQAITVSATGSYSVTVTGANGCSTASSATAVTVNANPATPVITASGPTTFCAGDSVTLTAPSASSYLWSNNATTQSITVSSSGSYSVTVRNASGCSATSAATSVTVNPLPAATITASGPTTFCAGGSVTLTASSGSSYLWSNNATTQSITVSASGSYSVTVTDANGCSATSSATSVTVNANPATPVVTASGPTTFCAGGSVTLTAPSASSYLWSNNATTQSITVSSTGTYSVTVTDANGCSAASSSTAVTVNANPATPVVTASGATTFCAGGNVTLTAPGGYSYLWSNNATTQSITVSATGDYSVTVTDANGCTATSAATHVTSNAAPATPVVTASGATTFCAGGNVTLTAPGGYSYLWSNNATTQSITVSATGDYSVTVTDANGCTASSTATHVTANAAPATPVVTASGATTFCAGGNVTLTAPGGYSYLWSNNATTQSITVSATGDYSVTITDANGCTATSAATHVTANAAPATPVVTASGATTFCAGGNVTLTAPGGYSYLWSNNATTQSITVSATDDYSVTVTDANGCTATSAATHATANAAPATPVITASGATTFCAGGNVTLTAPDGYSYLWSNNATTQSITVSATDDYSVTVTDANGCTATSAATHVTSNANPTATITATGATEFCRPGSVTLTASAGTSYLWSTGATTASIDVTTTGDYTVTVTDASGCSATSGATHVTAHAPRQPEIQYNAQRYDGRTLEVCDGVTATFEASPGMASYLWSNGATTQSITVSLGTDYSVTTVDNNGCSATSDPVHFVVHPVPSAPQITGPTSFCQGSSALLSAPAGYASYLWSNGTTGQTLNVTAPGQYSVTVTTSFGCSASSANYSVAMNSVPTASISGPTSFCSGTSATLTATAGTGYTYLWAPTNETTPSIAITSGGQYTVTITNAQGCSATATTNVTMNSTPPVPTITPSGSLSFCPGGSVTLTAPSGPYTYRWSPTNETTPSITVSTGGQYTVTVTYTGGSCSATSTATTVTVLSAPVISSITPTTQTWKRNQTATLINVAVTGASTYQWYNPPTATPGSGPAISGATSNSYRPPTATRGTFYYWMKATASNGCTANSPISTLIVN